jgi:hypothetical protein
MRKIFNKIKTKEFKQCLMHLPRMWLSIPLCVMFVVASFRLITYYGVSSFHNSTQTPNDTASTSNQVEFHIRIAIDTWDTMENCSILDYKFSFKSYKKPERCNYQNAVCSFIDSFGHNVTSSCKVRRKGTGTWRGMYSKPSFKIKKFENESEDMNFGSFSCVHCPPGTHTNEWKTNKITLNNQVQGNGEVRAYDVFRRLLPAPIATYALVKLFRGDMLVRSDTYVMLETIDDKRFMRKWFGVPYVLYEVEFQWWLRTSISSEKLKNLSFFEQVNMNRYAEFERYEGDAISAQFSTDDCDDDCLKDRTEQLLKANARHILNLSKSALDTDRILRYWAAETATKHWDGACTMRNNYYVAFNGHRYVYIPSGLDQTFGWWSHSWAMNRTKYFCPFINDLLNQPDRFSQFENYLQTSTNTTHN